MRQTTKVISILVFLGVLLFLPKNVYSSEGQFELANLLGEKPRCFAISVLLTNNQYNIIVTCRDLIYPADEQNSKYILWARNGDETQRLGSLGLGKASFNTKIAFNQLFVTLETDEKVKDPKGKVVMRGYLKDIPFLEERFSRDITTPSITQQPQGAQEVAPSVTPTLSVREKLSIGIKRSSIIAGVALLGLIGLVFVITKSRG